LKLKTRLAPRGETIGVVTLGFLFLVIYAAFKQLMGEVNSTVRLSEEQMKRYERAIWSP
jgi:hypothetical protein